MSYEQIVPILTMPLPISARHSDHNLFLPMQDVNFRNEVKNETMSIKNILQFWREIAAEFREPIVASDSLNAKKVYEVAFNPLNLVRN